ncbi:MAG TPA: ATP-grasp domain-containing protein [Streptosporangiaceae bacterium]
MRLLAVEARQNGSYHLDRYHQVVGLGAELNVLNGEGSPGFWPAGRYRVVGSAKIGDIVDAAARWHAQASFDGVLTFAESAIVTAAAVASALGLPGIGVRSAVASRNKLLMHAAHDRAGAPHALFRYAPTLADGLAAAEQWGYPVVIKPALGAASNFVFRADSPAEFARCYDCAAKGARTMKWVQLEADGIDLGPDGLVVESFLGGTEHLIEAVAWDGEVVLASVVDRVAAEQPASSHSTFEYNLHWAPTTLGDRELALVHEALTAAAAGQGLRRSVLHAEVRFHADRPHVLEVTPRPGGGGLERMARASAGYDPIQAHVEVACGRRPPVRGYQPTGTCTAAFPLICEPGTITSVVVAPELMTAPDLLFCRLAAEPGDVIKRPPDGNAMVGFIGATGGSRQDAMNSAVRLAKLINVTVAN